MLHGSETWPVRKENEVALQRAEMRKVRWMCDIKVKDRLLTQFFWQSFSFEYYIVELLHQ